MPQPNSRGFFIMLTEALTKFIKKPAVDVADPNNLDSQLTPSDLKTPAPTPTQPEADLLKLVSRRRMASQSAQYIHVRDTMLGMAAYNGNMWTEWNGTTGQLQQLPLATEDKYLRKSFNFARALVEKQLARATAQYPDVWSAPITDDPTDKEAAQIARSVMAHCAHINKRPELLRTWIKSALNSTTTWVRVGWNGRLMAPTGIPGPDGQTTYSEERIGDVEEHVTLPIDVLVDPNCGGNIHQGAYVLEQHAYSLELIHKNWPGSFGKVEPTMGDGTYASYLRRLQGIAHDTSNTMMLKNSAVVTQMWEMPSEAYKEGRFTVTTENCVLYAGDWPYEKKDKYPYVGLAYEENAGSAFGLNMIGILLEPQLAFNQIWTQIIRRLMGDKLSIFVPVGSKVSPDFYVNPRDYNKFVVEGGQEPKFVSPPPLSEAWFGAADKLEAYMEQLAGVHNIVGDDGVPANISGVALELAYAEDRSRLAPFIGRIESALVELAEWEIALYKQFGTQYDRILGLDDQAIPAGAKSGAFVAGKLQTMQALKNGNLRVIVTPGSGISKLPAAKDEQILELGKAGAFGEPGSPSAAHAMLTLTQGVRSNENVDNILRMVDQQAAQEQANQPNPMAVAQMQAQAAQQELQMKGEQEQHLAAIQVDAEKQKQAARGAEDRLTEQARSENALREIAAQSQADLAKIEATSRADIAKIEASANNVSLSLTAKAGPEITNSMAEAAGLEPDKTETMKDMLMPPKPDTKEKPNA